LKNQNFLESKHLFLNGYIDLTILAVQNGNTPVSEKQAELRCDDWPKTGSEVGAYGYPSSLDFSVTTGIGSGLRYHPNRY